MTNPPGYPPGYPAGFTDGTDLVTWPDTGSLTDSSYVRAIASRPVPSLPIPSRPNPGAIPHNRDQQLNGNHRLSAVDAEVAGAREAGLAWCWACDSYPLDPRLKRCDYCGAPRWDGTVTDDLSAAAGVYVIESDSGLAKIGMSRTDVQVRVAHLIERARRHGSRCWSVACLPGAGYAVERWLHLILADTRDPRWARAEGLPHPSEWFWPTPALRSLVSGAAFADDLTPEYIRGVAA